jgi:hypothetical protein
MARERNLDIRIGRMFRVRVMRGEKPLDYCTGDPARGGVDRRLADLAIGRFGRDFYLTVTRVGERLGPEGRTPAVAGYVAYLVIQPGCPFSRDVAGFSSKIVGFVADGD